MAIVGNEIVGGSDGTAGGGGGGGGGGGLAGGGGAGDAAVYQGTSAVESSDFEVQYTSATTLTLTDLPFPALLENFVGIYEYSGDHIVGSYDIEDTALDWTWTPAADVTTGVLEVLTATFGATSTFVVILRGPKRDTLEVLADLSGLDMHQSPRDFAAVYASNTTITITGMAMDPDQADIRAVVEFALDGRVRMTYTRGEWAFTWAAGAAGAGTLTIANATMQATSSFVVFIAGPEHGVQRADEGGAVDQTVKRVQHQDDTGGILMSLVSSARAGFVRLTNGTVDALLSAANTARTPTDIVLSTQPIDSQGNIIVGGGGTSGGLTLFSTMGGHFTAAWTSATEIDLAGGFPAVDSYTQFVEIEAWDAAGAYIGKYTPKSHVFSWDAANDRVTVTGAAFVTGGELNVSILGPDRTHNQPADSVKTLVGNHYELNSDDGAVDLITAAQNFTDAWVDIGNEIDLYGYSGLTLFFTLDINDDSDLRFRVLGKHESAGTEEYLLSIKTTGAAVVAVEGLYYEFTQDSDQLIAVSISTSGELPIGQVQIMRGTNGAGVAAQVDALSYIRSTFGVA